MWPRLHPHGARFDVVVLHYSLPDHDGSDRVSRLDSAHLAM